MLLVGKAIGSWAGLRLDDAYAKCKSVVARPYSLCCSAVAGIGITLLSGRQCLHRSLNFR